METVMTGWEIGFGFAVIFVALGVMFALWINNTPSSDEISAAEMERQYAEYLVTMDMRQKRRAQREAEDERRLKEEA
jgi:ABC-type lipoprotein release transport system permease subunit